MFQILRRHILKIYKSTAFWRMVNQTLLISKGEHLKILQIYREKQIYDLGPVSTRIENIQIYKSTER